jgi:hypothetical protein
MSGTGEKGLTNQGGRAIVCSSLMDKKRRKPDHAYIFKATWRGTSLRLRIEADDLEYAYRKAENMVRRMDGGYCCESVECIKVEY